MMNQLSIAAAALASAFAHPSPQPAVSQSATFRTATARPAIWVVNDEDTVIYLFGTFHALDGRTRWFNNEVRTALHSSQELVLETVIPEPVAPAPRYVAPVGQDDPGGSTSFLSTSSMVMAAGRARGMSVDNGADAVLREAAERAGKPVGGLESFEAQLGMFSQMPATTAHPSPADAPAVNAALSSLLGRLESAWSRGDIESFAPMLEQLRVGSPQSYKLLFHDRNARWASWIAQRLQRPGTVFVAVGAGHLSGRDSVQRKLAEIGVRSARIN